MAELLQWIQEHGSITAATKLLWRSEGSLRRMLKETEETLGYQLVQNDAYRGSCLTPEGEVLLDIYTTLSVEVNQYANLRFKELMRQRFKDMAI
jgi:molybdate transport repressor ModE-like protein